MVYVSDKIIRFVDINPGCTSAQIADGIGHSRLSVQQYMPKLYRSGKVSRKATKSMTNAPVYQYWNTCGKVPQGTASKGIVGGSDRHIESMIDLFAGELAKAVITRMQAHLRVEISRLRPESCLVSLPDPSAAYESPRITREEKNGIKIVIANLLPAQSREVVAEFSDLLVECWSASNGDGENRLRQLASHADAVFLNLSLSAHKHGEILKGMRANVIPVAQGGISSMKNAIYQWLASKNQLQAA